MSFINHRESDNSRLIKSEDPESSRDINKLDPKLIDVFDPRMEYVEGSLYVEVRNKDDNSLKDSFWYTGENPPVQDNTLTARILDFGRLKESPDHKYDTIVDSFGTGDQRKYVFVYQLRLKEQYRKTWDTTEDIKNTATFKYGDNEPQNDATVDIPSDMLQKSFRVTETGTLEYTLKVNPFATDLVTMEKEDGSYINLDSYKLVDDMSENLQLVTDSNNDYKISVKYYDDEAKEWKDLTRSATATGISKEQHNYYLGNDEGNVIYFILPDELAIQITYEVIVNGEANDLEIADNEATLYADETETENKRTVVEVGESGASGSSDPVVRLEKKDSETENLLSGVEFTLYCSEKTDKDGDPITVTQDGTEITLYPVQTYTTDEFGAIKKITRPSKKDKEAELKDALYVLIETKTPEGYISDAEPWFFRFPDYDKTGKGGTVSYEDKEYEIHLMTANETIALENTPEAYELPETGGIGTFYLYTMGGLLLAISAVLLYRKQRVMKQ